MLEKDQPPHFSDRPGSARQKSPSLSVAGIISVWKIGHPSSLQKQETEQTYKKRKPKYIPLTPHPSNRSSLFQVGFNKEIPQTLVFPSTQKSPSEKALEQDIE
mmetsp:Transcript_52754/g.60377  ORF Transcript_52754/g.60377 Transcript_52754/m.60377 type:complete len:103 (-) Transcript_52754:245-553(-)